MEELLSALQLPEQLDEAQVIADTDTASETEETVMKLSLQAVSGTSCKESIKLQGMIGKTHLLILIDSGSSNNFISEKLGRNCSALSNSSIQLQLG